MNQPSHYREIAFSMPMWTAIPPTSMRACTRNAPMLEVDGEITAFAKLLRKLVIPYNWLARPAAPTIQRRNAGICTILIALLRETHQLEQLAYIYKIFPAKGPGRLITFSGPLKGRNAKQCLEHSVGPGAVSCSFQLQESLFINKPGSYCDLPEECWIIAAGLVNETTKIDAGGVKASNQAHQGMGLEACLPESLFFGTCAINLSRGVKKIGVHKKI